MIKTYAISLFIVSLIHSMLFIELKNSKYFLNLKQSSISITVKLTRSKNSNLKMLKKKKKYFKLKNPSKDKQQLTKVITEAKTIGNIKPEYPWRSRILEEEGTAIIRAFINTKGTVDKVLVHKSSSFKRLDQSALDTILKISFTPATINLTSVNTTQDFTITFKLY